MAKDELDYPRVIYRGAEDPLGQGYGESKKCESAEHFKVDEKNGWRLERDPKHHAEQAKHAAPVELGHDEPADLAPPTKNAVKR